MWSNFHTLNNNPVGISSFYAYCINQKILFKKTHRYTGMSSSDTNVFSWLHSESFSGWQSELIIEVKKKESNLNITKISKQISTAMKLEVASKSFLWWVSLPAQDLELFSNTYSNFTQLNDDYYW